MKHAVRLIGIMAGLLLAVGVVATQAQPQFAGTWVLDRAQSQLPTHEGRKHRGPDPQAQPTDVKLVVEQQGHTVKATRTVARGNRERSMAETYVADGTEQAHPARRGSVVTRALFEGDRLVVSKTHTMKSDQGEKTMSRESTWSLSPDGKVLTIDTTLRGPRGERSLKSVYLRG